MKQNTTITISDVARVANVSISTVSRVINGSQHVRPVLRQRVQDAINQLNYVPNQQAQRLARGHSGVVGLLIPGLGSEYIAEVTKAIDDTLHQNNYDIMLYTTRRHAEKEDAYARSVASGLADGLLVVVPAVDRVYLDTLQTAQFPYVLVDFDPDNVHLWSTGVTNWQAAHDAVSYLLELGHRRIAIITDNPNFSVFKNRLEGYRAALTARDIAIDPALIKTHSNLIPGVGQLVEELLGLDAPPTAIFATSDMVAIQVMEALRLLNIQVPQQMSVFGFDDIPQAALMSPPLSTVYHPIYEMGQAAVNLLLERIKNPDLPPKHIQLKTRLVIRDSCAPPAESSR